MNKSKKKLLGILLTASIAATTVFPMQGMAAERIDRDLENVTQTNESTAPNESPTDSKTQPDTPEPTNTGSGEGQAPGTAGQGSEEGQNSDTVKQGSEAEQNTDTAKQNSEAEQIPEASHTPEKGLPETEDDIELPENTLPARAAATGANGVSPRAASYDINQPVIESFELVENGKTLSVDDTVHFKISAYDTESGIKSVSVSLAGYSFYSVDLSYMGGNVYTGSIACNRLTSYGGSYYVDAIRVEDNAGNYIDGITYQEGQHLYTFHVTQNTQVTVSNFQMQTYPSKEDGMLRPGDKVVYTAQVECIGGTLKNTGSMLVETCSNTPYRYEYGTTIYDPETQILTSTFTIKQTTYPTDWYLRDIGLVTENEKYFNFNPGNIEPDCNITFTVANDDYDWEKPVIESITIDKNGQTVKAGDFISVKVKISEENPYGWMDIRFSPEVSGVPDLGYSLSFNKNTLEYTANFFITNDTYPTKWDLTYLSVSDANGNTATLSDFQADWNTTRPWHFTVDPEGYIEDNEKPVIESITLDKNGQWVQPGDSVTMTVKVDEKNPAPTARASFYPQVSYVSGAVSVELEYHADIESYVGTIPITYNTYPCEWTLESFDVYDIKWHHTSLTDFKKDLSSTYPWYYRVKSGNTYREDVKDVTISLIGLAPQADGSLQYHALISTQTIENVGRRTSLKELGLSLPLPMEGVTAKWQYGWNGPEIDENSTLLFFDTRDTSCEIYAAYEQGCANVYLTYMAKDKGIQTAVIPQFVDKGTTYRELLDALPLPEDAEEAGFSGYKLNYDYEETLTIGDIAYIYAQAEYNNSLVAWNTRYLDKYGNVTSKTISRSYEKGTSVSDALAALEAPETANGLEFEGWILTGPAAEETLTQTMVNLQATAVYRGKTTVDVTYTYRGADGKLTCGNKLMFLNGENLSDAAVSGEATGAFKEVTHLKDLMLSEWKGSMEINLERYKKINFQALYYNCVAILKYPDETYQYVVLQKGSAFTLPTENETYTDILWEGYEKGETVTITEDQEFLAASAQRKDGTTEGPSGIRLSEEEIAKIITEIEQTEIGSTIRIDMKKATVVPKEVLEAIQGKEVNIVLDMGTYSWSIGGTEVAATDLKDIDLEITLDTDAIPSSLVDSVAEGKPTTQISLTHNGEFGFRADLTINLGSEHSGETGNLYYYDSSGKLVFRNAGEIGADGSISLSFSHASDYVVVIDKASSEEENGSQDETQNGNPNGDDSNASSIEKSTAPVPDVKQENKPKSPKTGE